jgi:hypothetical protein
MRTTTLLMLSLLAAFLMLSPFTIGEVSAQDIDGEPEGSDDDGFDLGWLGLLGLLGLLPRKPVDEHVDHSRHVSPGR